ncbi:integrase [Janthinobacterium sp. BJB301]|uniref:tyrosine-type recombinase/integrase n=1 Tax=Janthinobacterium sp. BJB301 TaxID=1560195 RepID=UPI000C0FE46D|nr:site-specific integrase [Janthinobacterium sp. BJB301]PHV51369.1 integrase [Janthinobacterium sp. BJB301]
MASFRKRVGGWRAEIAILGTRESKTFSTKAEAAAWASERETEIRRGADSGIVIGKSCGDAFDRYLEEVSIHKRGERWERLRLNAIGEVIIGGVKIKDIKLANVTPELLGAWRDQRMTGESKVTGATVNRELNLLSHVFSTARREWKWLAASPTSDVRRPKPAASRERIPTEDEIERLCNALGFADEPVTTKSQAVAVAYLFAIETAMRAGEICGLMPAWVDGAVARLPASINKNGVRRDVPLSRRALELLSLLPDSGEAPLFGISTASLDALFRKARERSCIEGLTFHDSRHAAITRLAKKLNVLDLARMVGHRDLRMLQVYYNESAEDMAAKLG